jgi:hypothetical protein
MACSPPSLKLRLIPKPIDLYLGYAASGDLPFNPAWREYTTSLSLSLIRVPYHYFIYDTVLRDSHCEWPNTPTNHHVCGDQNSPPYQCIGMEEYLRKLKGAELKEVFFYQIPSDPVFFGDTYTHNKQGIQEVHTLLGFKSFKNMG